jgi:hypothetical protein
MSQVTCTASGMTITNDYHSMFFPLLGTVLEFMGNILRSHIAFLAPLFVIGFTIALASC